LSRWPVADWRKSDVTWAWRVWMNSSAEPPARAEGATNDRAATVTANDANFEIERNMRSVPFFWALAHPPIEQERCHAFVSLIL
jgi:hypothetical protein